MSPAASSSSPSDLSPALYPTELMTSEYAFAKDTIISWFRGEFAAANAIIDALCDHLSTLAGYEPVFAAIHRRRLNWISVLQMQKYYSIADVTLELQKVAEKIDVPLKEESSNINWNVVDEDVDDRCNGINSPNSEITDSGSEEVQPMVENIKICSNVEDWEVWKAQIKMTKGFTAKECVKGHMVNVVRGLKLYENILSNTELTRLNDYVNKLQAAAKNGELSGETFISYNQQLKGIKRELIKFGAPIFGQIKDKVTSKSQNSHIEPIPAPLEGVIDHLIKYRLISEDRRPNSCIINFFDKGEFSQPFLKPPHLDEPISTLILSESTMAFGHTLVCDKDGNYKGPLTLSLCEGSLLVMRGNSADTARHATCQSPTKRTSITFFKVWIDSYETNSSSSSTGEMTVWQPTPTTPLNPINAVPKWGAPQLLMLAPVRPGPMVLTPQPLPRGGTGVFLPWNVGSRKPQKHQPPRAQRGRPLTVKSPAEPSDVDPTYGLGINNL